MKSLKKRETIDSIQTTDCIIRKIQILQYFRFGQPFQRTDFIPSKLKSNESGMPIKIF